MNNSVKSANTSATMANIRLPADLTDYSSAKLDCRMGLLDFKLKNKTLKNVIDNENRSNFATHE